MCHQGYGERARDAVRPRRDWWHDFNVQHRDVYRFLREFAKTRKTYWIAGTRLAMSGPGLS